MSSQLKIIFSILTFGFGSATIFVAASRFGLYLIGRNIEIPFLVSANPLTPFDFPLLLLCLFAVLTSLAVCPYAAHRLRETVSECSRSDFVRAVLSTLLICSQIIFLVLYCLLFLQPRSVEPPDEQAVKRRVNDKINRQLAEADIKITARKADIIEDNGENVTAQITLHVENIPPAVARYELQVPQVNEGKNFQIGARESVDAGVKPILIRPLNIEAVNENGKWIFYEGYPKKLITGDLSDEVTFRLDFFRLVPNDDSLPTSISPELKIRPQTNSSYINQMKFFYRPIPANFEITR